MASSRELINQARQKQLPLYNALPEESGLIDLHALPEQQGDALLRQLLSANSWQLPLESSSGEEAALLRAYFDARAFERMEGHNPFALGFPIYLSQDEDGETIAAPLLLWEIQLEPGPRHNSPWRLSRTPTHSIRANPCLLAYWQEAFGEDCGPVFERLLRKGQIHLPALQVLCRELSDRLKLEALETFEQLAALPSETELEAASKDTGQIVWSAALGLFDEQRAHSSATVPLAAEPTSSPTAGHPFSLLSLDPYQAAAAEALQAQGVLWAAGAAGTGKSALAHHLMVNSLANGEACLLLSPRVGGLREHEAALEKLGLGRLAFLLRDTAPDKMLMLDILRAASTVGQPLPPYDVQQYQQLAARGQRLHEKLGKSYRAYHAAAVGPYAWAEAVGQYLRSARAEGKEVLGTQLNAQDYSFSPEEYEALTEVVNRCFQLFEQTDTLHSPLGQLSPSIFLSMEQAPAKTFADEKTELLLGKANRLQLWYINRLNAYADQLSAHYEQYYQRFARQLSSLNDRMAEHRTAFGQAFLQSGSLRFKRLFSSQARSLLDAREEVLADYEKLRSDFERQTYFDFTFPLGEEGGIDRLPKTLAAFEQALQRWRLSLRERVQEEVSRLSRKSVNPRLGFDEQIRELEDSLDSLLDDVNETGLYHLPLSNKALTIPKRQRLLDEVIEQLEVTRRSLGDFDNFYGWQRNWLQLDEKSRRLVKALLKLRPGDWQAAYRTWFLDNALSEHYEAVLPPDLAAVEAYEETRQAILPLLKPHILATWQTKKEEALKALKRRNRDAHKWLMQKGEAGPLHFPSHWQSLGGLPTVACPALLMTPKHALELFSGQQAPFGLVIVEQAHLLEPEVLESLQALGKRLLLLSPNGLNGAPLCPPELSEQWPAFTLERVHSRRPADFRQAVQGEGQMPSPAAFVFEQVGGRYDERSESNEEEARRILALLNKIEQTPQRTYPSVGIVCMSAGQRRLIASLFLGIKQRRSPGVELVQQLERNGLLVMELNELGGQHFDILIVSGTFGAINPDGDMPGHIHRLEAPQMQQHLLALMSRPLQQVWALNSLPKHMLDEALSAPAQLLPAYFAYLRACANGNTSELESLIAHYHEALAVPPAYLPPYTFLAEVERQLRLYLEPGRLRFDKRAGLGQPVLHVAPLRPGQQRHAILVDGFLAYTPFTSFDWEQQQRQALQEEGYVLQQAWSVDWWRNPELEARRLASLIIRGEGAGDEEE